MSALLPPHATCAAVRRRRSRPIAHLQIVGRRDRRACRRRRSGGRVRTRDRARRPYVARRSCVELDDLHATAGRRPSSATRRRWPAARSTPGFSGFLLLQADEHARAVAAPARRGELADHHAGREGRRLRRIERDRLHLRRADVASRRGATLSFCALPRALSPRSTARFVPFVAPRELVVVGGRARRASAARRSRASSGRRRCRAAAGRARCTPSACRRRRTR